MTKDYYKILDIPEFSTKDEIKNAYRHLARRWHPDVAGSSPDVIKKFKEILRPVIINLTVGTISGRNNEHSLLNTFDELYQSGLILVSGAGNQGNTDIHYSGRVSNDESRDVTFQVGQDKNLSILVEGFRVDKFGIAVISPLGEISTTVFYGPNFDSFGGKFNL